MEQNSEEYKQFNSSYTPFSSVSDLMDTLRSNNLQVLQKGNKLLILFIIF